MRWKDLDIPDEAILTYIDNSERFRKKVAKRLASIGGSSCSLTAEERSTRAKKAAQARWKKDT